MTLILNFAYIVNIFNKFSVDKWMLCLLLLMLVLCFMNMRTNILSTSFSNINVTTDFSFLIDFIMTGKSRPKSLSDVKLQKNFTTAVLINLQLIQEDCFYFNVSKYSQMKWGSEQDTVSDSNGKFAKFDTRYVRRQEATENSTTLYHDLKNENVKRITVLSVPAILLQKS